MSEFFPHENNVSLDRVRPLRWDNAALLHAQTYFRTVMQSETSFDEIIRGVEQLSVGHIIACLYGALRSADDNMSFRIFGRIYKSEYLSEYISAVEEGITKYLPEPETKDDGQDLDPEYPDTQAEVKKNRRAGLTGAGGSGTQKKSSVSRSTK